jgi:PAS domain S-box-containing protein
MAPPPLPGTDDGYRAMASLVPDPVVVVDSALRVAVVNQPFLTLIGASSAAALTGRSILETLVEWERVRAANLVARFLATGVWDIAELTALHANGSTIPIEARCEMLKAPDGGFAGMLVMVRDLSARQEAEDPLRAIVAGTAGAVGEAFLNSLVRHLAQIFHVRFALVGELVEPAREQIQTVAFWSHDRFADNFAYDLKDTPCHRVAGGETCFIAEGVQAQFPEDAWLREVGAQGYLGAPLTDSRGRVIGLLEVLDTNPIYRSRDVTSIIRIFAARAGAELERIRVERELARSRDLLLQSQKLEGIGRLAGGVAHDFNNLLTAILGYGESASLSLPADSPARDDLIQIRRSALSGATLTERLLTFARRQTVAPRVLNLADQLTESIPILQRLAGERITIRQEVAPDLWPAFADPGQVEQLLVNLVVNAADAMPAGGELRLTLENHSGGPMGDTGEHPVSAVDWVRLTVSDTGIGMPPEVLALAFEPFFTTKDDGTGLGLATCHGIVRQAGGLIWAESQAGQGTRIVVHLPRAEGTPAQRLSGSWQQTPVGSETILVVEDEPSVRRLAVRSLSQLGYRVLEAADAEAGLAAVAALDGRLDMVVSDVLLPGINGPEMVHQMLAEDPTLKVLFVSGFTDDSFGDPGSSRPAHPFLSKPYTPLALATRVREALDT